MGRGFDSFLDGLCREGWVNANRIVSLTQHKGGNGHVQAHRLDSRRNCRLSYLDLFSIRVGIFSWLHDRLDTRFDRRGYCRISLAANASDSRRVHPAYISREVAMKLVGASVMRLGRCFPARAPALGFPGGRPTLRRVMKII